MQDQKDCNKGGVCVPVFKQGTQAETPIMARCLERSGQLSKMQSPQEPHRPDTRSPLDPWHDEGYLLRCLVRMHGWSWQEAGLLRRPARSV